MSLKALHSYLGQLLDAGVNPELPVTGLSDGYPCEIASVICLDGRYQGDPSPKLSAFLPKDGQMLVLIPIGEDESDLINEGSHRLMELPVEPPSPIK